MPGTLYCVGAILIDYFFGWAPAALVVALGLPIADILFVPPYGLDFTFDRHDALLAFSLPLFSLLLIVLIECLRRAQYRAELIGLAARSNYDMLLRTDNERLIAQRVINDFCRAMERITTEGNRFVMLHEASRGMAAATTESSQSTICPAQAESLVTPLQGSTHVPAMAWQPRDIHPDDVKTIFDEPSLTTLQIRIKTREGTYHSLQARLERFRPSRTSGEYVIAIATSSMEAG